MCLILQMGKLIRFLLLISSLFIVVAADWSILNQRKKKNNVAVGTDVLKRYCESWRINVEINNIRGFDVVPQECVRHIRKYMTSSQYKADSERALEEVTLYLTSSCCCTLEGDGKDAWIFDVDDTLISTIPYFKKHDFGGEKLNATSLEIWMKESSAPALGHTLKLFQDIKDRGFKIFLISSRRETLRSPSVDNLIKVGYHGWTSLVVLRGLEDELMEVQKYKSEARHRLIDEGYRIWGIIGDQWSSFEGLSVAKRTFKLPNSMYYI
ncbi:acid phosphatase 1-like [Argentina anserina]|uniref:acid phosphatase 1-like n=1 Tax=Argentina anserina TaxID=57926 RepID=UPI0021764813|nr:acid phosphatase 1-like [Potentilla anserina]